MPCYFLAIAEDWFAGKLRPALTACRTRHTFQPLRSICTQMLPQAEALGIARSRELLQAVLAGVGFDRHIWRGLVADLLLLAAVETPEIPLAPRSLLHLLNVPQGDRFREAFTPMEQVLGGSQELMFGPFPFRPLQVGCNDRQDVRRLADWLKQLDAARWQPDDLAGLTELPEAEDRQAELALIREGLVALRDYYARSAAAGCLLVCEPEWQ